MEKENRELQDGTKGNLREGEDRKREREKKDGQRQIKK